MTYKRALEVRLDDSVQPKNKNRNVAVIGVTHDIAHRSIFFHCDDGCTYGHKDVNPPVLVTIENGQVNYP